MHLIVNKLAGAFSSVFGRLDAIPHDDPDLTPHTWCMAQPCMTIRIAGRQIVISQPLSSFWVYLLGVLTLGVGLYFLHIQQGEQARLWWGIALLLWGIGALLAGTSYQAFGYQIKCAGKAVCSWTSWWEVVYLMFQQASINAMLVAVAYSCTRGPIRIALMRYALASTVIYAGIIFVGAIRPVKRLITFEFMLWVSSPAFFFFCICNTWRYCRFGSSMDLALVGAWSILLGTMIAYHAYDKRGITKKLWARGIWFSDNDVLHVLLILWMIYIATVVAHQIEDLAIGFL
jgi:hypothetical protein